jgi:hypothetical protein
VDPATILDKGARHALTERLGELTGEAVAGTGSDTLFSAVEAQHLEYFTPSGTASRKADASLRAADTRLSAVLTLPDELVARQTDYETGVGQHKRLVGLVLAEDGSLPVILDDPLVSTDPKRLRRMAHVLETVSEQLQVVFVTCHWNRFKKLAGSANTIDLGAMRERLL